MKAHFVKKGGGSSSGGGLKTALRRLATSIHGLLIVAVLGLFVWMLVMFVQSAAHREPPPAPTAMEAVDWTSPESSVYCLACHRALSPATGGLGAVHGHPLNVALDETRLAAIRGMGTLAGPGNTLICLSCHVLKGGSAFMLAEPLEESCLCQRCHADKFTLNGTPHDFAKDASDLHNRLGLTPAQAGPCSACHTAHTYAQDFEPCETDPLGRCVACHETPRCSGDTARAAFDHPESKCTECHNPHDDGFGKYLRHAVVETCVECHTGFDSGLPGGMHPLGPSDKPIPKSLVDAGARVGRDPADLTCSVCHSAHAGHFSPLLLASPGDNSTCLACHESDLRKRIADGSLPRHGQMPALNVGQLAAVRALGGRVSPTNTLICASCHLMHKSDPNSSLLAMNPRSDDVCASCHPKQAEVIGSAHDLRIKNPDEKNILAVTASQGGACSACHLGHGWARNLVPGPGDPTGVCTTCHQPDACAQNVLVGAVIHPNTKCTDCHDAHMRSHGQFLAKAPADLCADCHAEQYALVGGPHDWRMNPTAWPAQSSKIEDLCLRCHFAHGGERPDLYRYGTAEHDSYHDGACLTCHADAGWNANSSMAIIHPHQISPDQHKVDLALVPTDDQGNMRMGCRTCHNPHGGGDPVHLARVEVGDSTESLCLHCHGKQQHILMSGHSSAKLSGLGMDTDSCKPCHAMHAERTGAWGQMLSPKFLLGECKTVGDENVSCVPCLSCHRVDGVAPLREVFTHPPVTMMNLNDSATPGFLPLFNAEGKVDPLGQVTCRTCHLAHGWVPKGTTATAAVQSLSPDEQRAQQFSLRPFVEPNVCTNCHGLEGRWRFLFFHNPERRKGPGEGH